MCGTHEKHAEAVDEHFDEISLPANKFAKPVTWHSHEAEVVVPGEVWTVRGATKVKGLVDFPATMTIIKDRSTGDLVLVNSLRFDDAMNEKILSLAGPGSPRIHVVRLGAYHGRYDSFWKSTYGDRCTLWSLPGHKMQSGISVDGELTERSLPLTDASLFVFDLPRPEGVLILESAGLAVFCDAVLNISSLQFCGLLWKPVLKLLGFRSAVHGPEPNWTKWMVSMTAKGKVLSEFDRLLTDHKFDSYVGGHGPAEHKDARKKIRAKVQPMFS